jgi:RimJ/RimL family protein N-acetyltransferase
MTKEPKGWTLEDVVQRRENNYRMQLDQKAVSFTIIENDTQKICGFTGINQIGKFLYLQLLMSLDFSNKNAKCGIIIHHPFWRQGLSTECHLLVLEYGFTQLGLHKISCNTLVENKPMRSFYERYGIQLESINKEQVLMLGEYRDSTTYPKVSTIIW